MESRSNEQQQTDKLVKKVGNKRKRKRIEPLENSFDSPIRRENGIEKKVDILESNQQLILKKIDMLTNLIKNMRPSLPNPCQLKPTLPGQ